MNFENVSVLSVAHVDAPHRISSKEIERRLGPTMERLGIRPDLLRELSGILERRFWDEGTMPSEVAAMAGEKAIEAAGLDRSKLGILINTSVCRDYLEPSTACIAHSLMDLPETCMNFDLGRNLHELRSRQRLPGFRQRHGHGRQHDRARAGGLRHSRQR
jgi:3-oxoacyl-[acyl-carrier-protein] synthase-3